MLSSLHFLVLTLTAKVTTFNFALIEFPGDDTVTLCYTLILEWYNVEISILIR